MRNLPMYMYIFVSLVAIVTLSILIIKCNKKSCSGFCMCKGPYCRNQYDVDPDKEKKAYFDGQTEFQDFASIQNKQGGPKWAFKDFDVNYN